MSGRVKVVGAPIEGADEILTPAALALVADLHERFAVRLDHLLAERQRRQDMVSVGEPLDFLPETADLRAADWQVSAVPDCLPVAPIIDLSVAVSPTWSNLLAAHLAAPGTLRPRGFHLTEKHMSVNGRPAVATLVDAGLFVFHHERSALSLPLLESHLEARLWADLLTFVEDALGRAPGSTRVSVPVQTVWAAFETDELLHELRDRAVALTADPDTYLFSLAKTFRGAGPEFVLPERRLLDATAPFLQAYTALLTSTAHRRGLGGAAVGAGPTVTGQDLLDIRSVPPTITSAGLRSTVEVALEYLVNWLAGIGSVTIGDERVTLATADLCRTQLWQWRRSRASLEGGRRITGYLVVTELDEATERLADVWADRPGGRELLAGARNLLYDAVTALRFTDFIAVPAYESMP